MTSVLFHADLAVREFGMKAVRVDALRKWSDAQGLALRTDPDLDAFEVVQLEALLCAIERGAVPNVSDEAAIEMALALPSDDEGMRVRLANPNTARWWIAASVHGQWRRHLEAATAEGTLSVVDALSGLPLGGSRTGAPEAPRETAVEKAISTAHRYADEAWRGRTKGTNPNKELIATWVAKRLDKDGIRGPRGPWSAATVVRQLLGGWRKPKTG